MTTTTAAISFGTHTFQHPNIKCQKVKHNCSLLIDGSPKKSTVAISFGIVGAEVQDNGDALLQYLKFEFQPPMMVYLSINEMELVVRLIINKNVWHGIFELTYLVKIIHFLHVKRNFEDRGGDGACIRHRR